METKKITKKWEELDGIQRQKERWKKNPIDDKFSK